MIMLKQIQINSNRTKKINLKSSDEVAQTLIIDCHGAVYFHALKYGEGYLQYEKSRIETIRIDEKQAQEIIQKVAEYFDEGGSWDVIPNMGSFKLIVRDFDGGTVDYYGSFSNVHDDLTEMIQQMIPISSLMIFNDLE